MSFRFTVLLYCAVLWSPLTATAQQRTPEPGPAHPGVAVPVVKYESAFTGYVPFRQEKLASWREVNDEAARVGGHLGIFGGAGHAGHGAAKPAAKPSSPAPKPAAASATPMMHGGAHEGMKK